LYEITLWKYHCRIRNTKKDKFYYMQAELNVRFSSNNSNSLSPEEDGNYEVCIANISPKERKKRLRFSIQELIVTLIVLAVLMFTGADKLWRLPLFFMFSAAAVTYFQARDKT